MTMQHPRTWVVGDELNVTRLGDSDQNCVARNPSGLRYSPSLGAGHLEGVPMQMNRVVIHAKVDHTNADTISKSHDQRCDSRTCLAIDHQPVEFHVHGI